MKKTHFFATLLLFVLAAGYGAAAQRQPAANLAAKPLVLKGGLLIDGTGKAPLKDSVIIIAAGKIQSVGAQGSLTVPSDATVIDATGKTIIPGLVDSHVHFGSATAPQYLYWGVTTVGDMGDPRGWILALKNEVEKGRAVGPYIMAVGNAIQVAPKPGEKLLDRERNGFSVDTFLTGNGHYPYVSDEASLEAVTAEDQRLGVDAVKLRERLDPRMLKLAAQAAHRHGLPVFAHYTNGPVAAPFNIGLFQGTDEILDTGIDVHVHLFGLVKATVSPEIRERIAQGYAKGEDLGVYSYPEVMAFADTSKLSQLAQGMVDKKMFLNPTIRALATDWMKFSRYREEFDRLSTEFSQGPMAALSPDRAQNTTYKPYRGPHAEALAEGYRKVDGFIREFVQRGGKVIAGTDSGGGINIHVEMRLLEEAGLTPMQAIQAATSWGMEAWGKSKEVGTIEPGKRADLVILNRNPLEDLAATRDISQVIQGGKVVDREGLIHWKDPFPPRPSLLQNGRLNPLMQIPFINEISPDSFRVNQQNAPELILRGEKFTPRSQVLFNDRLIPAKFYSETRLGISLDPAMLKEEGTIPLVVVRPGSGGGVSNMVYVIVTPD